MPPYIIVIEPKVSGIIIRSNISCNGHNVAASMANRPCRISASLKSRRISAGGRSSLFSLSCSPSSLLPFVSGSKPRIKFCKDSLSLIALMDQSHNHQEVFHCLHLLQQGRHPALMLFRDSHRYAQRFLGPTDYLPTIIFRRARKG